MSKVMKYLKINKNDIKELNKFAYLCSVVTSTCGTEDGVKTHTQKASVVSSQFYQALYAS
jgi:hypothetical protein